VNDLRVALISHEFPPYTIGGIASHCYDLAYSLANKGVFTRVICGTINEEVKRIKVTPFLEIVRLPFMNFPPRYLWFQLSNYEKLCRYTSDCNVIHGVNPISSLATAFYQKESDKALVTTHHLNEMQTLKMFLQRPLSEFTFGDFAINALSYPLDSILENTWFKYADRIVVPGFSTQKFMSNMFSDDVMKKTSVIYNGINFDKINDLRSKLSVSNKTSTDPYIICYCRLVSLKGVAQLVSGLPSLLSNFPNMQLKIFGSGPLKQVLIKIIKKNNLSKNIQIFGHVPYEVLIKNISNATVAVFPTAIEVGPFIAALEAMACKIPIVLFNSQFNREFVEHRKTGLLASVNDVEDLMEKIEMLLSDGTLREKIGQNGFEYVKKNHDWSVIVEKYVKLYNEAFSQG
jgi:glycogen synthase